MVDKAEALALLKEIASNVELCPIWVSLSNTPLGYELRIKADNVNTVSLKVIVKKHKLALKEVKGLLVIYKELDCP
jgi:hypothetical protein